MTEVVRIAGAASGGFAGGERGERGAGGFIWTFAESAGIIGSPTNDTRFLAYRGKRKKTFGWRTIVRDFERIVVEEYVLAGLVVVGGGREQAEKKMIHRLKDCCCLSPGTEIRMDWKQRRNLSLRVTWPDQRVRSADRTMTMGISRFGMCLEISSRH